jgi:hypothetical protein
VVGIKRIFATALVTLWTTFGILPASAEPLLQLYIEGATYDHDSESWLITRPENVPLKVWAIANVDGPGGKGTIYNVKMAFAYSSEAGDVTLGITPTTTGGLGGFVDPSVAQQPTLNGIHTDGSRPMMSNGQYLPSHGEYDVYGTQTHWQEWYLGDMNLTDSPIADFIDSFPDAPSVTSGQINAYEIQVDGLVAGEWVHIDLYDSIMSKNKARAIFAPFSHDAGNSVTDPLDDDSGDNPTPVPAPGGMILLLAGLIFIAGRRLYRRA